MLIEELLAAVAMSLTYMLVGALVLLEAVLGVAALLLEAVFSLLFRNRTTGAKLADPVKTPSASLASGRAWLAKLLRHRWVRRAGIASFVCLGLTVAAVLVLNFAFFDWSVRQILDRAGERSGMGLTYEKAEGNLLTGRWGCEVEASHP